MAPPLLDAGTLLPHVLFTCISLGEASEGAEGSLEAMCVNIHMQAHMQAHICMHVCMRIRICRCACVDALLMPNGPMANGSSDPAPFSSLLVLTSIPMADVLPESTPVSRVSKSSQ